MDELNIRRNEPQLPTDLWFTPAPRESIPTCRNIAVAVYHHFAHGTRRWTWSWTGTTYLNADLQFCEEKYEYEIGWVFFPPETGFGISRCQDA